MTVSTTDSVVTYIAGGPGYAIPYRFLQNSDIEAVLVRQDGATETLTPAQYTITGAGSQNGGTLTSTYAASVLATPGSTLTISRVMTAVQPTDLRNQGRYFAETHENVFDRLTMLIQQDTSWLRRALVRPVGKSYFDAEGRRISNLRDPEQDQDAATKVWAEQYLGGLIEAGQGSFNLAQNVLYVDQSGIPRVLQDLSDPILGGGIVGWQRQPLIKHQGSVAQSLNSTAISVWEKRFTDLIIVKPDPTDPSTWDWTPAFQAAANSVAQLDPAPGDGDYEILIPGGMRYPLRSVNFGMRTNIKSNGAILCPFDRTSTETHLLFFPGFNIVYGITLDMQYALNYRAGIWMRGRHSTFYGVLIFRARYAWMFGDIAWATSPSDGSRGDSENVLDHCATVWCMTAVRAYGLNTILHFDNSLLYSYKPQMAIEEPDSPDLPTWESLPETTIINCGAIILIDGGAVCNFSGAAPLLLSQMQPTSAPDGNNAYGEFSISTAQLETGNLLKCQETPGYFAESTSGMVLTATGCRGYMSTTSGHYIDLGSDCRQSLHIDDSCRFYGNANNNVIYSIGAPVHVSPKAFPGITVDPFQAIHARSPICYERFCGTFATSCAQSFGTSAIDLKMPMLGVSDIWSDLASEWYESGSGQFTPRSDMRNVEFDVSLVMNSGLSSDVTNFVLLVNGSQVDIAGVNGSSPRALLRARRVKAGDIVRISVSVSVPRTASGQVNNRLMVIGSL